jgi:hypothetical protein
MPNTTRAALPFPVENISNDIPFDIQQLAVALDPIIAIDMHGTLATRPAAGVFGRYYTDENGITYRDNGTGWVTLNSMPVGGQPGQALVKRSAGNYVVGWGCPVVNTLPATPGSWQECILDNQYTGWQPWHLMWDGNGWQFMGGPELVLHQTGQLSIPNTGVNTLYAGPIQLPAGDFAVNGAIQVTGSIPTTSPPGQITAQVVVPGGPAADQSSIYSGNVVLNVGYVLPLAGVLHGVPAAGSLGIYLAAANFSGANAQWAALSIRPIKLV